VRGVLVDAGPLVALLDQNDLHHAASVVALRTLRDPLVTVWPALTEAMCLLGSSWRGQKALWSRVETGALTLAPLDEGDAPRMRELMEKYRDLPMDLADPALVRSPNARISLAFSRSISGTSRCTVRDADADSRSCPSKRRNRR
jgi:hypothetical protein